MGAFVSCARSEHAIPPRGPRPEGGFWWEKPLPAAIAVRKEARELTSDEHERIKAAVLLMARSGRNGTSQYFRLAVKHGGMVVLDRKMPGKFPAFCAHRRLCFASWHRPYIYDFECMLRLADMHLQEALGKAGGELGLPCAHQATRPCLAAAMPARAQPFMHEDSDRCALATRRLGLDSF
jgi:hypothetical protein